MTRPNVIYIHSHDTGRYVQPYGYAVPTPNIQRLAEGGVLFRQNHCAAPTCSPSRAALVTGQAPHSCGQFGLVNRGFVLRDQEKHFARTLKKDGYSTNLIGVQHVVKSPEVNYDHVTKGGDARRVGPEAAEFLANAPQQPFLLTVGFGQTHRAFEEPGDDEDPRYTLPPAPLPDTPQTRHDMAAFKATAKTLDTAMGQVFDALDESGLAENTLVICTTDHGLAMPGMKCNLTDHGTGVMLIIRGPGGFTGGTVIDALTSHVDVFPTICEVAGIERPNWLQGKSLTPLVNGDTEDINDVVFSEVNYHCCYEPGRMVRSKRWKYIRRFYDRRTPVLPHCDDSLSKEVWMSHGWKDERIEMERLYDLVFDPNETNNLAARPDKQDILGDMSARLKKWMVDTNDPLLDGHIEPPVGAKVTDDDEESPKGKLVTVE